MKITAYKSTDFTGTDRYVLEIDCADLVHARLDNFDRHLIRECEASNSVADNLLALETLARRIEQAAVKTTETVWDEATVLTVRRHPANLPAWPK